MTNKKDQLNQYIDRVFHINKFSDRMNTAGKIGARLNAAVPERTGNIKVMNKNGRAEIVKMKFGDLVGSCYSRGSIFINKKLEKVVKPIKSCGNKYKLCPHHARIEQSRLIRKYYPLMLAAAEKQFLYFVTIAPPNIGSDDIEQGRKHIWAIWKDLFRNKIFKSITGSFFTEEYTVNRNTGEFNLHLHGIIASSEFINYAEVRPEYGRVLKRHFPGEYSFQNIQFKAVNHINGMIINRVQRIENSLKEIFKYIAKFETDTKDKRSGLGFIDWPDINVQQWIANIWRKKTRRAFGIFYNQPVSKEALEKFEAIASFQYRFEAGHVHIYNIRLISVDKLTLLTMLKRSFKNTLLKYIDSG